ncbi:sulfatase-like hydrolase/transferase [Robiginitomaculum antarcticum]|uniref:sulfatase-like hydrolase/transferase n=1 Tax=Robiginitomaculum antarcticum TaxID=437507 RepID=UPI00039E97CD|nr:sulfatase-like hydrolase/transferase [Robiginitomaculum antarcticum]
MNFFKSNTSVNTVVSALISVFLLGCSGGSEKAGPQIQPQHSSNKPNIVLLFVDDLAWMDIRDRSGFIETPNIDRLSKEGISFERAYSPAPVCSPSRVGLITGEYPAKYDFFRHVGSGVKTDFDKYGNALKEFSYWKTDPAKMPSKNWLPLEATTIAERLKPAGYNTHFVGKWHIGHDPFHPIHQGFDTQHGVTNSGHPSSYYPPYFKYSETYKDAPADKYLTDRVTDDAVEVIANAVKTDKPFFLNLWWYGVHRPTVGQKEHIDKYLAKGVSQVQAEYATQVEAIDNSVGRIEAALKDAGVTDNTIVVFTSDQGGYFARPPLTGRKGGGLALFEGGARVPLIVKWPAKVKPGQRTDLTVSLLDVAPTLMSAAGANKEGLDGVELMTSARTPITSREPIILYRHYENEYAAVIDGAWKLMAKVSGDYSLYNTQDDISEKNDVAGDHPERVKTMTNILEKWKRDENIRPIPE